MSGSGRLGFRHETVQSGASAVSDPECDRQEPHDHDGAGRCHGAFYKVQILPGSAAAAVGGERGDTCACAL